MKARPTTPFLYPAARHKRTLSPGPFTDYRKFKEPLRQEFGRQCIYCRMPDHLRTPRSFDVEHYRPKKLFPQLLCHYPNLFYACSECNSRKGQHWPSAEALERGAFIPNPCDHVMTHHVRFDREHVRGVGSYGDFMIDRLQLNHESLVEVRKQIQLIIADIRSTMAAAERELDRLKHQETIASSSAEASAIREVIEQTVEVQERRQQTLDGLLGG